MMMVMVCLTRWDESNLEIGEKEKESQKKREYFERIGFFGAGGFQENSLFILINEEPVPP